MVKPKSKSKAKSKPELKPKIKKIPLTKIACPISRLALGGKLVPLHSYDSAILCKNGRIRLSCRFHGAVTFINDMYTVDLLLKAIHRKVKVQRDLEQMKGAIHGDEEKERV